MEYPIYDENNNIIAYAKTNELAERIQASLNACGEIPINLLNSGYVKDLTDTVDWYAEQGYTDYMQKVPAGSYFYGDPKIFLKAMEVIQKLRPKNKINLIGKKSTSFHFPGY